MKDDNDRLRAGTLPADPEADAEQMPGAPAALPIADLFRGRWRPLLDAMPDLFTAPLAEPRWLLRRGAADDAAGVLRQGKVGLFVAAGGVGKTQALVQLAIAVAVGGWWLDTFRVAAPGRVLLALAEEDEEEVRRRIRTAAAQARLSTEQRELVLRNIVAMPLAGMPVALVQLDDAGNVGETAVLAELRKRLHAEADWRLVVLDPLSRWAGADSETDNAAATRFIEAAETLVTAPGSPTVLIAHHTPKAARPSSSGGAVTISARGASALEDGARWVATLAAEDDREDAPKDVVTFEIRKSNYAARGEPLMLTRDKNHAGALRPMTAVERKAFEAATPVRPARARTTAAPRANGTKPSQPPPGDDDDDTTYG